MLNFLGKIGKGKATITGIGVLALSLLGKADLAQQVVPVADGLLNVGVSLGGLLASFGVGGKGGAVAAKIP